MYANLHGASPKMSLPEVRNRFCVQVLFQTILAASALGMLAACAAGASSPTSVPAATTAPRAAPSLAPTLREPRAAETRGAETRGPESSPTSPPTPTVRTTAAAIANPNPFGILISLSSSERQNMVKSLGVTYFRPDQAIVVDQWDGTCAQCDAAMQMGLKLILTVRANGGKQDASGAPQDMAAYQKTVGNILDKYHTDVLIVENEENSTNFYTSAPEQYGAELKAACQVAHSKGIKCANGGMVSNDVALLAWENYFGQGASQQACDFARRALEPNQTQTACGIKTLDQLPPQEKETLSKDKAFLQQYKSSGADYMNFHWYIADANALAEAAAFLQSAVGLPLMTNEMGQQDDSPATVTNLLTQAVELKLPYVIWFSIDPTDKTANNANKKLIPTALNNTDSTLRPTGEAFKAFIQAHFR
jgi:hypothetical protein